METGIIAMNKNDQSVTPTPLNLKCVGAIFAA